MADSPPPFSLPPELRAIAISDTDRHGHAYKLVVEAQAPGPFEQSFIDTGYYQPVARLLTKLLRARGTLIDLGANIGTVCLPVAMAGSNVVAVELLPRNVMKLRTAASLNGLSRFRVVEAAVTSSDGPVGFLGSEAWGHISQSSEGNQAMGLRLDTILARIAAEEPDFLQNPIMMKVDVEGHELDALRGAEGFLKAHRPIFIFESIESAAEPPGPAQRVKEFVNDLDYAMYCINGYVLSEHQVTEPQIGLVSDILAVPKEISLHQTGVLSAYVARALHYGEQIELLEAIAHHSADHFAHAKAITSLLEDKLLNETQALFRLRSTLGMTPGKFPALEGCGQIYDGMSTVIGRADIAEEMRVFACNGSTSGCLLYGPYCAVTAGTYDVTFVIKVAAADLPPQTQIALLDTTMDGMNGQSRFCVYGELNPDQFTPIRFRFDLHADVKALETRIVLTAPVAMTVLAAVAIAKAM